MIIDVYNPSDWRGRNDRILVEDQPGQNDIKTPSQSTNWVWWHASVTPATWEAQVGG
jgi:hypothetical protein